MSLVKVNKATEKERCLRLRGSWEENGTYASFAMFPGEAHQTTGMGRSPKDAVSNTVPVLWVPVTGEQPKTIS